MASVDFEFDVWLRWWAKPLLLLAVALRSSALVGLVRDRGVRLAPRRR